MAPFVFHEGEWITTEISVLGELSIIKKATKTHKTIHKLLELQLSTRTNICVYLKSTWNQNASYLLS